MTGRKRGIAFAKVRGLALRMPGATEGQYYGRPSFFVGERFFAGYREDLDVLVAVLTFDDRDFLIRAKPKVYFITDHYLNYPTVLVRLAVATEDEVREILGNARDLAAAKGSIKRRSR